MENLHQNLHALVETCREDFLTDFLRICWINIFWDLLVNLLLPDSRSK